MSRGPVAALYDIHGNLPALEAVLADVRAAGVRVVNAGSVGMPFGEPGAYWLLLGPDVELRRTAYDLPAAAERVRATEYPQAEEFAARNILQPPAEQVILAMFAHAELI